MYCNTHQHSLLTSQNHRRHRSWRFLQTSSVFLSKDTPRNEPEEMFDEVRHERWFLSQGKNWPLSYRNDSLDGPEIRWDRRFCKWKSCFALSQRCQAGHTNQWDSNRNSLASSAPTLKSLDNGGRCGLGPERRSRATDKAVDSYSGELSRRLLKPLYSVRPSWNPLFSLRDFKVNFDKLPRKLSKVFKSVRPHSNIFSENFRKNLSVILELSLHLGLLSNGQF